MRRLDQDELIDVVGGRSLLYTIYLGVWGAVVGAAAGCTGGMIVGPFGSVIGCALGAAIGGGSMGAGGGAIGYLLIGEQKKVDTSKSSPGALA